ncbi:enhanced intracellular survival protein Eis [Evansella sp. AB-rgal1]|uniref:GNAT family N-acetyltransferase n=1 Tax=Evansella sp. AB-rgal1 TaxID=3242696 RepID=UPI00359CBF3F
MEIRKLKTTEIDLSIKMSEYAFQYTLSDEERVERREYIKPEHTWVAVENDSILSKASIIPFQTYIYGKKVPMGGVSGVATWPEHRRSGLVKELLFHSLKEMKQSGQVLSFLYPFSIPFYRKYGWELFAEKQKLTLTREQLPKRTPTEGYVRRVQKDEKLINNVYDEWATHYNGCLIRETDWWKKSIFRSKKHSIAVYYNSSDEPRGYMIYYVESECLTIDEIIWLDPDSRNGLFSFIGNHDSMIKKAIITITPNDGMPHILPDPKVEREIQSYFMARIVDVKKLLDLLPHRNGLESVEPIILHITDEFCSWNDGVYFIRHSPDMRIEFYPTKVNQGASCKHPPKKGIRLSVQTLAALLLHAQSMDTLYSEGFILGDKETADALADLIPKNKPFIYDFF